ncbi:patatin-like phospholipase family protein [Chryseolinea lacunae]|uniref:Patatin-like phospholipase family protein n=1 Tax=Chryseolinea lacunae TaxID=2801331 RepID=A0ABS1KMA8_9BACT|nr:patatin-like phospholipase family protein [Chryseolinea lacunae]MBL0740453.1 patatin-like phospholipase family protein [Chryseolinea lacunae]
MHYLSYMTPRLLFLCCLMTTVMATVGYGQGARRPKIGVVLSGGGAKGMAHIGVLKTLEEAGIRPDYITGTSMGSIVGGLYAIGYSADDLKEIVTAIDWDGVLTNKIPLDEIAIEEKPYYGRYILELPLQKKLKVGLPGGIIEGEILDELLFDLTRPVHDIDDFRQFPIPFSCVATDISTGQPVVLHKGNLAQSLRASMAIPTVFTPVEINDTLLVDGGLVRNFPVQEVIDMGADIVIGVFVSSDLNKKEKLKNFIAILFQSSWVLSAYDTRKQKEKVDYYVEPELGAYSTGSFKDSKAIIDLGLAMGQKLMPRFRKLADSLNAFGPQATLQRPVLRDAYVIGEIRVEGNETISTDLIKGNLRIENNSTVFAHEIESRIELLYGTGYFNTIGYQLKKQNDRYDLVVNVAEAPTGKIKAAVHYDTENKAGVNLNVTLRNFLLPASRAIVEIDLAEFPRANLNYLKYIGRKQNAAGMFNGVFSSFSPAVKGADSKSELYTIHQYALTGTLFATAVSNRTIGLNLTQNFIDLKPKIADPFTLNIQYIKSSATDVQLFVQHNNLERPFYPRKGGKGFVTLTQYFNPSSKIAYRDDSIQFATRATQPSFLQVDVGYLKILPVHKRLSIIADSHLAWSNIASDQLQTSVIGYTYLGGFRPRIVNSHAFYGAGNFDYSLTSYFLAKLDVQWQLTSHVFFTAGANYVTIEHPMDWFQDTYQPNGDLLGTLWRLGYGASLGYNSPIGPISVSATLDSEKKTLLGNFSLGFFF